MKPSRVASYFADTVPEEPANWCAILADQVNLSLDDPEWSSTIRFVADELKALLSCGDILDWIAEHSIDELRAALSTAAACLEARAQ